MNTRIEILEREGQVHVVDRQIVGHHWKPRQQQQREHDNPEYFVVGLLYHSKRSVGYAPARVAQVLNLTPQLFVPLIPGSYEVIV